MKKLGLLVITMLALTGCPDNKNNNTNLNGTVGLMGNCIGCGFNPAVFSQPVSSEIPQAGLTLVLSGDANQMNVWARNGQNPLFSYQGPISVTGNLTVAPGNVLPFGTCQLPAGNYTIRTIQAGIYNVGVFQLPALELVGINNPYRMNVAMTEGVVLTDGNGSIIGFGGLMVGLQGPSMIGWGYPQQNMGMSACNDAIGVRF